MELVGPTSPSRSLGNYSAPCFYSRLRSSGDHTVSLYYPDVFFRSRTTSPDLTHCIETTHISLNKDDMEQESPFSIIEWVPESVVVLKKSTQYWLVVPAPTKAFG
ncbi:hypothetical protein K501DRAFT_282942 [Backusella circina FSU 941]|nr:hypothetical protein K501DRAFT_282942 [Backusella circina FSU 941]